MELKRILDLIGLVSGLVCAWDQTIASTISAGPPPLELRLLPWKWEDDADASNLLGIPTTQSLSMACVEQTLISKLDGHQICPSSLAKAFMDLGPHRVWQFTLPVARCSIQWIPFMDLSEPDRSFVMVGSLLMPTPLEPPNRHTTLQRIITGATSRASQLRSFGPWKEKDLMITKYHWPDGTPLSHSSTLQLRLMQTRIAAGLHIALSKWTTELGLPTPDDIWQLTWLSFHSAQEYIFLWQILYQILATQRWRFPTLPPSDPVL